ncbi:hypothetical protein [Aquabacterium sp. J223]|uniref:hypothetical protein n=1 Tax=Aquabacterium sp. J223 TaxID=2898431 RepID=UPI0021ADA5C6|nr:hypothetical protein [Aquabacterium sp. J223]UUX94130.1 hypothetical protein LRS07_12315 [Aquabacterium sp. J223]
MGERLRASIRRLGAGFDGLRRVGPTKSSPESAHRGAARTSDGWLLVGAWNGPSYFFLLSTEVGPLREEEAVVPLDELLQNRPDVVISRYLERHQALALWKHRQALKRIVYFMDDDLMDEAAVRTLPEPYRSKVGRGALHQRKMIESLCNEFWVSTPYLAQKYAHWQPRTLPPRPLRLTMESGPPTWICYHGTASHEAEFQWLVPVIEGVQSRLTSSRMEVFGGHKTYKRFSSLPRVNVLHPMTWPNYLDYTAGVRRDIALAPLLPSLFNAGRAPTKFFDHARMHAVGLYSDVEPYRSFVRDGVDGLLLPNDADRWVTAILELAADAPRRQRMAAAARDRAMALAY